MSEEKGSERLTETMARRILMRATELEQIGHGETTVVELRELAREAGISMSAFEAALREAERSALPEDPQDKPGFISHVWSRLKKRGSQEVRRADALTAGVAAAMLVWLLTAVLTRSAVASGWQAMEITILVSMLLGVGIARALRAHLVAVGLLGLAAFQASELAMHSIFGIEAVQGGPTHWAVMIAGVLGALLGARFGRGANPMAPHNPPGMAPAQSPSAESEEAERPRDSRSLRSWSGVALAAERRRVPAT